MYIKNKGYKNRQKCGLYSASPMLIHAITKRSRQKKEIKKNLQSNIYIFTKVPKIVLIVSLCQLRVEAEATLPRQVHSKKVQVHNAAVLLTSRNPIIPEKSF